MTSNKGTTGRGKKSANAKKTKQPIPIDSGIASQASVAIHAESTLHTQAYISLEEEIRFRAYELYEERGRQDGMENDDWIRAETEILAKHNSSKEKSA